MFSAFPSLLAQSAPAGGNSVGLFMIVAVFAIFYFLLILPAQRRQRRMQQMHRALKNGDRVITTGGLRGTIVSVKEDSIHLRIPPDKLKMEVMRSAVTQVEGQDK